MKEKHMVEDGGITADVISVSDVTSKKQHDIMKEGSPTPTNHSSSGSSGEDLISVESFEDLLRIVGDGGKWQLKVFLLASFVGFLTALHNLAYAFIGAAPDHWCQLPGDTIYSDEDLKNLTIPQKLVDGKFEFEKCSMYNYTFDGINGEIQVQNTTIPCTSIYFDDSIFKSTITSEWNLSCGKEYWASAVQSIFMFGILFGSPINGALSDKFGRKKAILISSLIFILAGPMVGLAPNFTLVMVFRFILAAASPGIYGTSFVLVVETIGMKHRGLVGNLFCLPFAFGYMALPAIAYLIRDWRTLQIVLSAPSILLIFTWWALPESPRWLLRKGRIAEAEKILRDAAAVNGKKYAIPPNFSELISKIGNLEKVELEEKSFMNTISGVFSGYADLLRSPKIRTRTLVLYVAWMSISLIYYGVALNSPNLSTDRYMYTFISGVLEIPSYFMVPPLIRIIGRRPVFSGFLLLTSASLLLSLLFEQGSTMIVILALFGKLLIGSAYALIYLYATELLPTLLRTYGLGTASMAGRIGSATAPFIVDILGKDSKKNPTIVFGTVALAAGLLTLILPETRNRRLPETIKDVEDNQN